MAKSLTFVLGGAASGKSAFAEGRVRAIGGARHYVATAQAFDDEMRAKIRDHQAQRGPDWTTHDAPFDLAKPLSAVAADQVALVDCMTLWLTNHILADHDIEAQTEAALSALHSCAGHVVIVSNETGYGIVPENALARRFRNEQGRLNQRIAAISDTAVLVVAGLPMALKGTI